MAKRQGKIIGMKFLELLRKQDDRKLWDICKWISCELDRREKVRNVDRDRLDQTLDNILLTEEVTE
jgi:hypothetical protein